MKRLELFERNVIQKKTNESSELPSNFQSPERVVHGASENARFTHRSEGFAHRPERYTERPEGSLQTPENVHAAPFEQNKRIWNPPLMNQNKTQVAEHPDQSASSMRQNPRWSEIVQNGTPSPIPNPNTESSSWRQRLHFLQGTNEGVQGGSFSADIDIVAFNVAKIVTSANLCHWLSERGLFVKDCKLLTTSEEARSLSFKVTIDPKDFDRATKDAHLWPYRVGVRLYKNFNKNNKDRNNINRRIGESTQARHNIRNHTQGNENRSEMNSEVTKGRDRRDSRYVNYRQY